MSLSREDARRNGRLGGLTNVARHGAKAVTAPAFEGLKRRFLDEVDPDRVLDPEDRERRAHAALRAHMARLSPKGVRARQERRRAMMSATSSRNTAAVTPPSGMPSIPNFVPSDYSYGYTRRNSKATTCNVDECPDYNGQGRCPKRRDRPDIEPVRLFRSRPFIPAG